MNSPQRNHVRSVSPRPLAGFGSVHVGELADTEAIGAGGVRVAVHRHGGAVGRHLERLADLLVQLKVGDRAPELRRCTHNLVHH